MQLQQRH